MTVTAVIRSVDKLMVLIEIEIHQSTFREHGGFVVRTGTCGSGSTISAIATTV